MLMPVPVVSQNQKVMLQLIVTLLGHWQSCLHHMMLTHLPPGWHLSVDWLWSSTLRGCWWVSSCVAVEANTGFAISAATLACEDRCLMWVLVVLLMTSCCPGLSFIIFFLDGSLSSIQSLWHLLFPQGTVICKGFPWLSVSVACFHVTFSYILVA